MNAILTFVFIVIVTLAASIPGVRNTTTVDQRSPLIKKIWFYLKKYKKQIGVSAGILGAITGFLSSVEQDDIQTSLKYKSDTIQQVVRDKTGDIIKLQTKLELSKAKSDLQQDEIRGQQKDLYIQQKALTDSTGKIANLYRQLADSQREIARLAVETTNNVTGGDSYCMVKIIPISSDSAQVMLVHKGRYPLSDLRISIERKTVRDALFENLDLGSVGLKKYFDELGSSAIIFKKNSLPADNDHEYKDGYVIGYIPFKPLLDEVYLIDFSARNGRWTEWYRFRYNEKGEPRTSYAVGRSPIKGKETRYVVFEEEKDRDLIATDKKRN